MTDDYDILIIGGGMVGASLARSINGLGLKIGVVEAWPFNSDLQPSYDDRVIALSWGTRLILQGMGVWEGLSGEAEPISDIHISDRGHFGFARLNNRDEGVEALGYVATARALGQALLKDLEQEPDIDLLCPASLKSFSVSDDFVEVNLKEAGEVRRVRTALLVAADGGDSAVRGRLAISSKEQAYGQTAIIANITTERPHQGVAYERFTNTGPLAMLPMTEGRSSLVWTSKDEQVTELMALDETAFLERLQARFGYRLGHLTKCGKRFAYPLKLRQANEHVRPRIALIGNAAHTVHPVTGQGFNLGIRDVAVLADLLADVSAEQGDPGSMDLLQRYADWRRRDQNAVAMITDTLARLFANPLTPLRLARNVALLGLDSAPGLKHLVARQFMGLNGRLPRLARGIPLV
ncbi:MAG: 2-octaprenyl-6-methoxyphenyl hydroxylase [gamma proteobacterium endosymbiont of Lamellibrachia anaximandri]|nr:2-octaprenyl-6-methoxyphenyl hydroxylase [gamma proteobacterium endosymbiont of Lamellibrachia anaximandri]MBL3616135.1 2-octaprenyl-6-methoxyphenyl hydroxylase [gamma proteobacterium endosymbiont of Lamellibrachia anaximandri]